MKLLFQRPTPLTDALVRLANLQLLPTGASSADIQQWSRDVRAASLFSARTTHAGYLERIQEVTARLLSGEINIATGRAELQDELDRLQYNPEAGGFPGDTGIPPADRGSLRDLSSDQRLKLVLETQASHAANFALKQQGSDDLSRYQFPAWELVRVSYRDVPRDEMPNGISWPVRWGMAGGRLVQGRMAALKDDAVWAQLGSSTLFPDGLDSDVPPYAFNSGMGWREVPREEAIALGLITGDEAPQFTDSRFFDETKLNADQFETGELQNLLAELCAA